MEKATYAAAAGGDGWQCVVAYAAEAVDCDGLFAGVDGARASTGWQAVECCGALGLAGLGGGVVGGREDLDLGMA